MVVGAIRRRLPELLREIEVEGRIALPGSAKEI